MLVACLGCLDGYTTNTIIYLDQYADPVEGFSRINFCAAVIDLDARGFLMAKVDVDRVMMGSGYSFPIVDPAPKGVVHAAGLSANIALAILGGNALKPSHLEAGCDGHH